MNLTAQQFETFKETYANAIVLNMSENDMREQLFNMTCDELDKLTFEEIKEEIVNKGCEDILDYLITTATSDDRNTDPP